MKSPSNLTEAQDQLDWIDDTLKDLDDDLAFAIEIRDRSMIQECHHRRNKFQHMRLEWEIYRDYFLERSIA